jgi:hypothetical protein
MYKHSLLAPNPSPFLFDSIPCKFTIKVDPDQKQFKTTSLQDYLLPDTLNTYVNFHFSLVRPVLLPLGFADHNFLFVRHQDGRPLTSIGLAVATATKTLLGVRINAHFFRSIVASALLTHRLPVASVSTAPAISTDALATSMLCSAKMVEQAYFVKPLQQQNAQNQQVLDDLLFGPTRDPRGEKTTASNTDVSNEAPKQQQKRCKWSEEETRQLLETAALSQQGVDWSSLAKSLPGKSIEQIKTKMKSESRKRKSQPTTATAPQVDVHTVALSSSTC